MDVFELPPAVYGDGWVGVKADKFESLCAENERLKAERDHQRQWADYYRNQWLGGAAVPPAPLPSSALKESGND